MISPDGTKLQVQAKKYRHEYRPFDESSQGLPSKLKPWYQFAANFVDVVRKKSPKLITTKTITKVDTLKKQDRKLKVICVMTLSGSIEVTFEDTTSSDKVTVKKHDHNKETLELTHEVKGLG